jgi:hypothetical protein
VGDSSKKPSAASAQATFDTLLGNVRFSQSTYDKDVICALMPCQ